MKKTAITITGVLCMMLVSWSFSNAAEELKVIGFVNINHATLEELVMLPDIDEMTAKNIVYYRESNGPFSTTDELLNVKGMNPEKLESVEPILRLEGKTTLQAAGL